MSDLQCPARLLLVTDLGQVERPSGGHAAVYASPDGAGAATAAGPRLEPLPGMLPDALEDIADLHRGEDVLVLLGAAELRAVTGRAAGPVRLDVDADGWVLGTPDPG